MSPWGLKANYKMEMKICRLYCLKNLFLSEGIKITLQKLFLYVKLRLLNVEGYYGNLV